MGRDAFGGPSACHITHQSVGSGYLGPVTGTVAECAAWLIRLFLQIADQWLWVGRWIFPFSLPLFFFFVPLLTFGTVAWCIWCFHEVYLMTDTSRRGRQADWLAGRSSPALGFDMDTQTLLFPPLKTALHPSYDGLCAVWKLNQSVILENYHQHHSLQADPVVWFIIGMLVPEWPPWEKQSIKAPHRHPVRIRVIFNFKEVIQWFCTA